VTEDHDDLLDDLLAPGLDVVFVGTAVGKISAKERRYYANRGNRFWRTLYEIGSTDRILGPHEYKEALAFDIGFTDLCKTQSGMDRQVIVRKSDIACLHEKILQVQPRSIAFNGKGTSRNWLSHRGIKWHAYGQIEGPPDFPSVFVLPSTSGANNGHWQIGPWKELAAFLRS
jgi:double-stranded uracil-DNA glycosylase